jgi:hypothetical protein
MMFLFLLSPVTASPIFCPVDFSSWGWTAEVMLKRSAKKPKKNSGRKVNSRVDGTLDVVGSLLNVRLLRVGLGCGSSLVGEGLSALFG